jgi:hypothetical protein
MKTNILSLLIIITALILSSTCISQDHPLTTAESSNYKSTSTYDDVRNFIAELQKLSSQIRVEKIATTVEGKDIPMIILGDPPPFSPLFLKDDNRLVVYLQANIHAGEVEGKEGLQILARDILLNKTPDYLDRLIILITPIFNADGNDKISKENRKRQLGPENGVGIRPNGQNLDLNRDGLKLETPEVKGLVKNVLNRWDPYVILDSHTHNGSYHEEPVTFIWSLNPNGDTSLIKFASDIMYPDIVKNLQNNYDILCIPHGDFVDAREPEKGWRSLGPQPRYLSNYFGLRNRIGILNENYPYVAFKDRVSGCYKLFRALLDFCYKNSDDMKQMIKEADRHTVLRGLNPAANAQFAKSYDVRPVGDLLTVRGWEMEVEEVPGRSWPKVTKTDIKKTYRMPFLADYYPKSTLPLPYAYVFDGRLNDIAAKLREHGIIVERLTESVTLNIESFIIEDISNEKSLNQGHYQTKLSGSYKISPSFLSEGTFIVMMSQPLSNVVAYLLEPESDDGLVRWNFFDRYITKQWSASPLAFPVMKLYETKNIPKQVINIE